MPSSFFGGMPNLLLVLLVGKLLESNDHLRILRILRLVSREFLDATSKHGKIQLSLSKKLFTLRDFELRNFSPMFLTMVVSCIMKGGDELDSDIMNSILELGIFPYLSSVVFRGCENLTDEAVRRLAACPKLASVNLSGCFNLTDEAARALAACPLLASVNFSGCSNLTDEAVRLLAACPALTSVDFRSCCNLTDEAARSLAACLKLASVDFSFCFNLTNEAVRALAACPLLASVVFTGCSNLRD